jgi:putative ABC transport system substrate-binding protein
MSHCIGRRAFITLLGGAVAAWPLLARAQQANRVRRIGILMGYAQGDPEAQARLTAFKQGLASLGWSEDHNLQIELRWGAGDIDREATFARELVALQPDAILANTTPVTAAIQRETTTIPVVFVVVSDPVGSGFVESLRRPGGKYYRLHQSRRLAGREVAGAAQGDIASHVAGRRHVQPADRSLRSLKDGGSSAKGNP